MCTLKLRESYVQLVTFSIDFIIKTEVAKQKKKKKESFV